MVHSKAPPQHAEVRPLKCIVYMTRNPVTFEIHWHHEFYLLDQQARETKYQAEYKRLGSNGRVQIHKSIHPTSMCQSIFFTTCLPKPNSISTTHFATKLGRQGCGRKTKARRPNDRVDHNDFNHNNTSGNSL